MSVPNDICFQFSVSAGNSSGPFSVPKFENLSPKFELRRRATLAYNKYETRGDLNALDICIQFERFILDMAEDDSPEKADALVNLSVSLWARYKSMGDSQDVEESISLARLADALTPDESPVKHGRLTSLACSLFSRFEREGRLEDLEDAVSLQTRALELLPDDHTDKPSLLNNLGASLRTRFEHSGKPDDLDKAISLHSHAVDLTPEDNPNKAASFTNLGNSLEMRFEQFGSIEDIEKAIALHSQAADLIPDGHPNKISYLTNAGTSLQTRFERLGNMDDLSRAIQFRSRAVDMSPDSHPGKPALLNNLAVSLLKRFGRTGDGEDLEQAIAHQNRVVALTPDGHPGKPSRLSNLAAQLRTQFERSGSLVDLDAAIAHSTNALTLTPEGRSNRQQLLYNLANVLKRRFCQVGDAADLDDAIRYSTQSVELLPEDHTNRAQNLRLLGLLFKTRLQTPLSHADDAVHAMEAFHKAMLHPNSHPLERLCASGMYTDLLAEFSHRLPPSQPFSLLNAYKHAVDLIPQCVWRGNDVRGRYTSKGLHIVRKIVDNAATTAIAAGEYSLALEWLETGRAVVWSQVLQLRTPLDDLRREDPQLADDLRRVSQALQRAVSSSEAPASIGAQSSTLSLDADTKSSHGHVLEYENLLADIRRLNGFENFMRPKTLSQLAAVSSAGPVVVINIHRSRCDALILHLGEVKHVALPNFSVNHAERLRRDLWSVLSSRCLRGRFRDELEADYDNRGAHKYGRGGRNDPTYGILKDLWDMVVKPILDVIRTLTPVTTTGGLPHVTWCPTGPLAFLPLHAAGIYQLKGAVETVMDHVVSSYTPTLEALLKPRARIDHQTGQVVTPPVLVVSQPAVPGYNPIPATTAEAGVVMSLFDIDSQVTILEDEDGSVDAVLSNMATHKWVHLACHGIQDGGNPLNSAFLLHDKRLTLEMLMSQHIPNADLAVLSACQTATGDERLTEEAVHLAAGMLNLGYKSVIGTMWSIYDSSAPVVMGEFYRVMLEQVKAGGELHPAYALHEATKALREKYGILDFVRWIPFVHFGL